MPPTLPDEERGIRCLSSSLNTEDSSSDDNEDAAEDGRFNSLLLSAESSFNTNVSEHKDRVPELASLVNNNGAFVSYGSAVEGGRSMHARTMSDESINTVAALPGMVLRAHAVSEGKRGSCAIRHSLPKVGECIIPDYKTFVL